MIKSLTFGELRDLDLDRLEASFSFKPLNSAKSGADGRSGDPEALRTWRAVLGER
jgi:hypothetical protein